MMRRCSTSMAVLASLLAFSLGSQANQARAAAINPNASTSTATVDYRLTSSTTIPVPPASLTSPQVVAMVVPTGSVVPPTNSDGTQGSPLTILPDSHGFDSSQLVVALKDTTSSTGQPEQQFGLVFYGQGLQPGGVLHFALSINSAMVNNPPQLQSLTPGISIVPDPPATSTPAPGAAQLLEARAVQRFPSRFPWFSGRPWWAVFLLVIASPGEHGGPESTGELTRASTPKIRVEKTQSCRVRSSPGTPGRGAPVRLP